MWKCYIGLKIEVIIFFFQLLSNLCKIVPIWYLYAAVGLIF